MTNWQDLAMTYGGFTSLDMAYLETLLSEMTDEGKKQFLTPPPSVVNAYFAEHYQKNSPEAATAYYFGLCRAFDFFSEQVNFDREIFPFIRLNLQGEAYGFAYATAKEEAYLFGQKDYPVTRERLLEVAQLFPHYHLYLEKGQMRLKPLSFEQVCFRQEVLEEHPLVTISSYEGGLLALSGYNAEEIFDLAERYEGKVYYQACQRALVARILPEAN